MDKSFELVKKLYKNDYGNPFEMTKGQVEIFDTIFKREQPRNQIESYTQYGKSEIVAMAVLTRVSTFPEKWAIIAPTLRKARIIMGYVIKHIFENDYTRSKFQIGKDESEERIKRERSKSRLTFKIGEDQIGEIFVLSAESHKRNSEEAGNSLLGYGAPNLVEDESALISDNTHSKGMRMLGGHKDNFLVKIGNPFRRNHFLRSHNNPAYKKIIVDYKQGIEEGRINQEFIAEMKNESFFDILYEVKFPTADTIDEMGFTLLLTPEEISLAMREEATGFGVKRLGVDVARGGMNYTVFVFRTDNLAEIILKRRFDNLVEVIGEVMKTQDKLGIEDRNIFIDDTGIGGGVTDGLRKEYIKARAIKVGEKADDEAKFVNLKAEAFWRLREWIKSGGMLKEDKDFYQLSEIKYRADEATGKLRIESKEAMRIRGIESPDVADALMLTFARLDSKGPKRRRWRDLETYYQIKRGIYPIY